MQVTFDFAARLKQARLAVANAGITALLVSPGADLGYLTGYRALPLERLTCLVVPAKGPARIVVPMLEGPAAAASALTLSGIEIVTWRETEDPYALVASLLPKRGVVAIDDHMWASKTLAFRDAMPGAAQRAAGRLLSGLRMRKTTQEVSALREAGAAIDAVHARMGEWLRAGRTERAVGDDVRGAMLQEGHASADFVIVGSGPNAASPHHEVSDRVIGPDDPVVVDISGTMPSGYCSDSTRTYVVGQPSPAFLASYAVLKAAQEAACAAVRPGASAAGIDAAAREIISDAGYGDCFLHRTGHGIGLEVHEEPYIAADNQEPLEEGMVFSIEPGIYLTGQSGARIEDIVVCTQSGVERLNLLPRDLVILDTARTLDKLTHTDIRGFTSAAGL
jgi:Xaa-Pro aminopeptidase